MSFSSNLKLNNFLFAQVILLVIALGQILARSVGSQATPFQAPYPVIYSQRQAVPESNPIWLEKAWR